MVRKRSKCLRKEKPDYRGGSSRWDRRRAMEGGRRGRIRRDAGEERGASAWKKSLERGLSMGGKVARQALKDTLAKGCLKEGGQNGETEHTADKQLAGKGRSETGGGKSSIKNEMAQATPHVEKPFRGADGRGVTRLCPRKCQANMT